MQKIRRQKKKEMPNKGHKIVKTVVCRFWAEKSFARNERREQGGRTWACRSSARGKSIETSRAPNAARENSAEFSAAQLSCAGLATTPYRLARTSRSSAASERDLLSRGPQKRRSASRDSCWPMPQMPTLQHGKKPPKMKERHFRFSMRFFDFFLTL